MNAPSGNPDLRVLVNREDDPYIAQGVDDDIVAFGDSPEAAIEAFGHAFIRQCLVARHFGDDPLSRLPPSPAEYAAQWEACASREDQPILHFTIPSFSIQPSDTPSLADGPHRGAAMIAA
jgi:hypothetical protein